MNGATIQERPCPRCAIRRTVRISGTSVLPQLSSAMAWRFGCGFPAAPEACLYLHGPGNRSTHDLSRRRPGWLLQRPM